MCLLMLKDIAMKKDFWTPQVVKLVPPSCFWNTGLLHFVTQDTHQPRQKTKTIFCLQSPRKRTLCPSCKTKMWHLCLLKMYILKKKGKGLMVGQAVLGAWRGEHRDHRLALQQCCPQPRNAACLKFRLYASRCRLCITASLPHTGCSAYTG